MGTVERLKARAEKCSRNRISNRMNAGSNLPDMYVVDPDEQLKLLAAFEARGELLAAIDDYYGVGFTRGESTPEVQRITDARAKHAKALRELEGE